jgi:tRNA 2-thiocytidine biosynthesis protein TtcA
MNKGEMTAMPVLLSYKKYPISLIRPLAYLEEQQIIACASKMDILSAACTCPYGINSDRRDIRSKITQLTEGNGTVKRRILSSLSKGKTNLLIETGINGEENASG